MAPWRHTGHRQLSAHLISADAESFATILILLCGALDASDFLAREDQMLQLKPTSGPNNCTRSKLPTPDEVCVYLV